MLAAKIALDSNTLECGINKPAGINIPAGTFSKINKKLAFDAKKQHFLLLMMLLSTQKL